MKTASDAALLQRKNSDWLFMGQPYMANIGNISHHGILFTVIGNC
jgi:hypothetical protein